MLHISPCVLRGAVERLEFWPVNVMFGRRFPFLPSNWCRGILGFKRGRWKKKNLCGKLRGGGGRSKPTGLLSCTEPKLGFSGCYSRRERLGSLRRENGVALEK